MRTVAAGIGALACVWVASCAPANIATTPPDTAPTTSDSASTTVTTVAVSDADRSIDSTTSTLLNESPSTTSVTATVAHDPTTTLPFVLTEGSERQMLPSPVDMVFGRSLLDEPLVVARRGDVNGARILIIGSIHGDEDAGVEIVNELADGDVPAGIELWLVPTMNPDGNRLQQRHNANGVDLNRNFPERWAPLAEPGNWQYGGPSPASEPETAAMVALGEMVAPDLVLWYHQDLFRITPTTGRNGEIRARYAELTGLPLLTVSGGTYTGTASQWSRTVTTSNGTGFTIELGPSLTKDEVRIHADAVRAVATEFFSAN